MSDLHFLIAEYDDGRIGVQPIRPDESEELFKECKKGRGISTLILVKVNRDQNGNITSEAKQK